MKNKLSYSQVTTYAECGQKWKYHYKDKLRPKSQSAALLFGSALDRAVAQMLKPQDATDPKEAFKKAWSYAEVNKRLTKLDTCADIVYADADCDLELLKAEDIAELKALDSNWEDTFKTIVEGKASVGWKFLPDDKKSFYNKVVWHSLYRKGLILLHGFEKQILPNIEEVLSVQEEIGLDNESDEVIGFIDFVVRYKGYDSPVIVDLKTASRAYDKDAVLTSPQLATYLHAVSGKYKTRYAGYIVLNKQVNKNKEKTCTTCDQDGSGSRAKTCDKVIDGERCSGEWSVKIKPTAFIQVLIDKIPVRTEELVLENLDAINESMHKEIVHRNFNACIKYGKIKCPFYGICWENNFSEVEKV